MRIDVLDCGEDAALHIWSGHRVTVKEVEEAVYRHHLAVRGRSKDIYLVFSRSEAGRYLLIVVRYLGGGEARLITARDMSHTERRRYDRHRAHQ